MLVKKLTPNQDDFPEVLANIPDPPKQIFVAGNDLKTWLAKPKVAIVGSRKASAYGKAVTAKLASELAKAGVVVISGLALGIDGAAHSAALQAGGTTIAVLPCGLDNIYPSSHRYLAKQILDQGGALISEYPVGTQAFKSNCIARNRLVSGLADGLLVIEAAARSGTLSTTRFALEQGREVMAVPGNITNPSSIGTNNLIKSGATPITEVADIFHALGIKVEPKEHKTIKGANPSEQLILDLIGQGTSNGAELLANSGLDVSQFNQALTMCEITGKIRSIGNNHWSLA